MQRDGDSTDNLDVIERYTQAVNAHDTEALSDVYTEDAVIWHNYIGQEASRQEEVSSMQQLFGLAQDFRLTEVRLQETPTGFVQQHVARGTASGGTFEMPVSIVGRVRDGRIERMEGYLDPKPLNAVMPSSQG